MISLLNLFIVLLFIVAVWLGTAALVRKLARGRPARARRSDTAP